MGKRWFSLWLLGSLSIGCGGRSPNERILIGPTLAMHFGQVDVYEEGTAMPIQYEEIAFIRARVEGDVPNEVALEQLRNEAASLGADAIVHLRVDRSSDVVVAAGVAVHVL